MRSFHPALFFTSVLLFGSTTQAGKVPITQWTFEGHNLIPTKDGNPTGNGTASLIGGTTSANGNISPYFAGGSKNSASGWVTSNYPAQSGPNVPRSSGTAGVQFMVSTAGYKDIVLSFDHRASSDASRWSQVDYTLDGGINWTTKFWNNEGVSPDGSFYSFDGVVFPQDANGKAGFGIRIVSIFSPVDFIDYFGSFSADKAYHRAKQPGSTSQGYATTGTWRFDNVTFSGTAVPEPSSMALMGLACCLGLVVFLRRRRKALLARQRTAAGLETGALSNLDIGVAMGERHGANRR